VNRHKLLKIWSAVAVVALAAQLGGFPLLDPDEGRNAEVGREMALTNDYVMPRLDGLPYLDKPIVYFAAEAAAMEVLGATETAARLPALLFTFATALMLWWFADREWGRDEAWIAFIAGLSMPLTIAFSRTVIFDSALAFFITAAMIGFYLAIEHDARRWAILAWAAIGLGVITKGPVAIALPLLVAIPFGIVRKRVRPIFPIAGIVVFAVVIAPWVWAISRAVPDFLNYVLVTETAQRLATKALKRTGPPWYFIPYLLGGALPWSFFLIGARIDRRDRGNLYLLLWIAIPFLFFSISQSKRPQYILPLMPAIALLTARVWCRDAKRGTRIAAAVLIALGIALLVALPFVHLTEEFSAGARASAIALGACALVGGAVAFVFTERRWIALVALSLPMLAIPIAVNPLMEGIGARRSTKALMAQMPPGDVVGVEAFTGSMEFYLRRPIIVVTPNAEEFTSNYLIRHYDRFAGTPSMQRPSALPPLLATNRSFVVRENDAKNRALLEQHGLRVILTAPHYVVYAARTMR